MDSVVISSWAKALFFMLIAVMAGVGSGRVALAINGPSHKVTRYLQYVGLALLLWATLGSPGWAIQSSSGNTPAEVLDRCVYRTLHMLGSYFLAFSIAWPTARKWG